METELLQNTLWPEKEKLYGHGFEIMAVGTSPDGKYIASSCKASKAEYAEVIIWSSDMCTKIKELSGHVLTDTSIQFSPDNNWLVTAGRDRMWILYQRTADIDGIYNYLLILQILIVFILATPKLTQESSGNALGHLIVNTLPLLHVIKA